MKSWILCISSWFYPSFEHDDADQQREALYSDIYIHIYMHVTHIHPVNASFTIQSTLEKNISDLDLYFFLSPNSIIICSRKLLSDIVSFWKICMTCSSWMYDFFTRDIHIYIYKYHCYWEDRRHKKNIGILLPRIKSASGGSFFSIST